MSITPIRLLPLGIWVFSTALAGGQTAAAPMKAAVPATKAVAPAAKVAAPLKSAGAPVTTTVAVETAAAPAWPRNPVDLPPKPPRVICSGDQLTITAENSTLDSILVMVRGCSGARVEIPEGAARVRSYEQLGPGPMRKVLDSLLSGTEFNYVLQSSDANPQKLEAVLLTARLKDGPAGPGGSTGPGVSAEIAMTPARRAWTHMQKFDKPDPVPSDDSAVNSSDASPASESAAAASAEAADATPAPTVSPENIPTFPADSIANADPSKVENRITSMQQMFDQRRQMMEKQNAGSGQSPAPAPNN
jgi:hypothetical protein